MCSSLGTIKALNQAEILAEVMSGHLDYSGTNSQRNAFVINHSWRNMLAECSIYV